MSLMKVGDLDINREDLTIDTIRKVGLDNATVHGWLMLWQQRGQGWDMTKEEALIGMGIALNEQLADTKARLELLTWGGSE